MSTTFVKFVALTRYLNIDKQPKLCYLLFRRKFMKNEIKTDKYGFILYDTQREKKNGRIYSNMHYGNEKTLEDVIISWFMFWFIAN